MKTTVSETTSTLLKRTICWDNHACMPLRPSDVTFLPQLERLRQSGIDVVSLNISFDLVDPHEAFAVVASFRHWIREHAEQFSLVNSVLEIQVAKTQGRLGVFFNIEGGNVVAEHPGLVEVFYRLGVRWMLFAYNKNSRLGGGCMDVDTGLTDYGRLIIREMERCGMVLCCSHVGNRTAREAIDYAQSPVIFSHSNPSAVYEHVRNIPDDLMVACANKGGVVNINGVGMFLGKDSQGRADNSTETLVKHIDYAAQLVGPQHVGLGLDYVFDVLELEAHVQKHPEGFPTEIRVRGGYTQVEPERFPIIAETLLKRGYSEADVQGIMGHNNLRVARQCWK